MLFSSILLPKLVSGDILVPTKPWPPIHISLLFLILDLLFNFFVTVGFFRLLNKDILSKGRVRYFLAILTITVIGMAVGWIVQPIKGYEIYASHFTVRTILSAVQIISFPFVFSWFKLSDKKTAFKVGAATVILAFVLGSIVAFFYIGWSPVSPVMATG